MRKESIRSDEEKFMKRLQTEKNRRRKTHTPNIKVSRFFCRTYLFLNLILDLDSTFNDN